MLVLILLKWLFVATPKSADSLMSRFFQMSECLAGHASSHFSFSGLAIMLSVTLVVIVSTLLVHDIT